MTREVVLNAITQIFREVFERDDLDISERTSPFDIDGWDSIKQIDILIATEEHFNVHFTTKQMDGIKTVGDLVDHVVDLTAGR